MFWLVWRIRKNMSCSTCWHVNKNIETTTEEHILRKELKKTWVKKHLSLKLQKPNQKWNKNRMTKCSFRKNKTPKCHKHLLHCGKKKWKKKKKNKKQMLLRNVFCWGKDNFAQLYWLLPLFTNFWLMQHDLSKITLTARKMCLGLIVITINH